MNFSSHSTSRIEISHGRNHGTAALLLHAHACVALRYLGRSKCIQVQTASLLLSLLLSLSFLFFAPAPTPKNRFLRIEDCFFALELTRAVALAAHRHTLSYMTAVSAAKRQLWGGT